MESPSGAPSPETGPATGTGQGPDDGSQAGPPVLEVHEIGSRTYLVADVEPLDVTGIRTVAFGTLMFLGGGLGLLPSYDWLEETDRLWWLWTCGTGAGLGLFGIGYCLRRARHLPGHMKI